jgi:hypothetical protein
MEGASGDLREGWSSRAAEKRRAAPLQRAGLSVSIKARSKRAQGTWPPFVKARVKGGPTL